MIVLEVKFVADENEFLSMSTDVLGVSKDLNGESERSEFETAIIPFAYNKIEEQYKNVSLVNNEYLCADMMNVIVKRAKEFGYILGKLGQNKDYPDTYQLQFKKEETANPMDAIKEKV